MIGGGRPLLRENLADNDPPLPKCRFSIYFRQSNVFRRFVSVVGKASLINPEISPTLPNIHRGQKVQNLASFSTLLNFEPPAFEKQQNILSLKLICNAAMIALLYVLAKFGEAGSSHP